jgi:predicted RNA polymerase sigma factor
MESPKLIAGLMRIVRDVGIAEDLAHDALVAALEEWPRTGSTVVALNHAVAVSMAFGPKAALDLIEARKDEPALRNYHLRPSVRGDLLEKQTS